MPKTKQTMIGNNSDNIYVKIWAYWVIQGFVRVGSRAIIYQSPGEDGNFDKKKAYPERAT